MTVNANSNRRLCSTCRLKDIRLGDFSSAENGCLDNVVDYLRAQRENRCANI
jgi:hypothetical protein